MNRHTVESMIKVAQKISAAKKVLSETLSASHPEKYMEIRELLNDCQEIMAIHCDTAPIKLITGQVKEIMTNYEEKEEENFSKSN